MNTKNISLCLPKGNSMQSLADYLEKRNFPIREYHAKNRTYRPEVLGLPVRAKIMAEKDIPIQVAVGNYDIGFCGTDWVIEHTIRYRTPKLHLFKQLGLDKKQVVACTGVGGALKSVNDLLQHKDFITIVSEYPNLSEHFAISRRIGKFKVFPAWGSVEAYPPEHADVVILSVYQPDELQKKDLHEISTELESELCIVVNRKSFIEKNLSPVLQFFSDTDVHNRN